MTHTSKAEAKLRRPPAAAVGASISEFKGKYDPTDEVRHLRAEVKRLERELGGDRENRGSLTELFHELLANIDAIKPPKIDYRRPKTTRVATPIVHVSHWTDWHEGAVQDPDEVEGFRQFNPAILRTELRTCVRDQLDWVELHRSNYVVDESRDLVTGDLISGGIHPELLWTNEYPEPVQAIGAGELLAELIATKAPHYKTVTVDFVTVDNHGRLTKKPQASEAGINCWGYVVGAYAKERLRLFKNVIFNVHAVIQTVVNVAGRKYLLSHGSEVRGWSGFPYYGLERKAGREAVKRMQENRNRFDRMVIGHWHAPLEHPWYLIGGSASGTTAYDHREGRHSRPCQCAWFVHPGHGEFDHTNWMLRGDT